MREPSIDRDHVTSLQRGLGVMEILAAHPSGLTLTETADRAELTRAGARRLLLTLVASGYATQSGRTFALSPRLLSLARSWLQGTSLWAFAEPFMRRTATELQESCSAAVLAGEEVVYVARVQGPSLVSLDLHVGARLPAHCTAMGRVLLSAMDAGELDVFLTATQILPRTDKTVTEPKLLAEIVAKVRKDDYAIVDEELEIGLRSLAVPLRDRSGRVVAALNASTQSARHSAIEIERRFLPLLKETAARIEDFFV